MTEWSERPRARETPVGSSRAPGSSVSSGAGSGSVRPPAGAYPKPSPQGLSGGRELALEAAEFVSCDPERDFVLCDTYLYEPELYQEPLGSLSLVLETIAIPDRPEHGEAGEQAMTARDLLTMIASTVRGEYYRDPSREMFGSFEAALGSANAALAALAQRGETNWVMNLNAATAAFHHRTLHVSRVGGASVYLCRRGRLTDVGAGLADPRSRNPRAAFSAIASGTVAEHDALVLASPHLFDFVSREQLPSFLSDKSPQEAIAHLRELFVSTEEARPLSVLLLRFVRAPIELPAPSISSLPTRASARSGTTERPFLAARPWDSPGAEPSADHPSAASDHPGRPIPPGARAFERLRVLPRQPLRIRPRGTQRVTALLRYGGAVLLAVPAKYLGPALSRARGASARAASAAAYGSARSVRVGIGFLRRAGEKTASPAPSGERGASPPLPADALPTLWNAGVGSAYRVVSGVSAIPNKLRHAARAWPKSTKIFFALTLILALLFAASLKLLSRKRAEDAAIARASELLQAARVKSSAAEAALIYDNTDEARRLLLEARAQAGAVEETSFYDAEVAELLTAIQTMEDRTERIVRIEEPARAGDFGSVAPDGKTLGLALVGAHLFTFHPETNAIFRLSTETGAADTVAQTSQGIGYVRAASPLKAERMLLLATDAPGLALFDSTRGDLIKQELKSLPEATKEIRALATFGSRLYLLLPEHRQVYGFSKTLAGYTGGAPWLKDADIPADRAVSMGVDGYIYLLTRDGKIVKLLKGSPVDFAQSELAIPLVAPTRLLITDALKYLYVLDPPKQRVVVYDTTGKLSRQFVFPNATDLKAMDVGGKDETLYLLDRTAVYRVPLK